MTESYRDVIPIFVDVEISLRAGKWRVLASVFGFWCGMAMVTMRFPLERHCEMPVKSLNFNSLVVFLVVRKCLGKRN
ncbi:hypothetical protein [Shewanella sp. YLB-07]|uniref:hypothetical protein n=1 Tax=Shewanella sp. YLB-07 TaxID=2601268 RepID=UPI00128D921D|nr:hypothetical protein [Shewanella sp. YLB-07]MPY24407.1 hypothetical protein [Shewanella sp. YLB-07]